MSVNSWPENDSCGELEELESSLTDLTPPPLFPPHNYARRRFKAAVFLGCVWGGTLVLHFSVWGSWLVMGLAACVGVHGLRILWRRDRGLVHVPPGSLPSVSLLVAAKDEEAVIGELVESFCHLDYPPEGYELWVVDDCSTDRTPEILQQMCAKYPQLQVLCRPQGSTGGKSGALNQVLPLTRGEIIAVFDADAQVTPDLLRQVVPLFDCPQVGAVQVSKAIANAPKNLLTQGQSAEMALDAFFQRQRILAGGIGELRGNGQFVRRVALERCGGWNEETITDDLDLTLRLHLDQWDIDFLSQPRVQEEGVTGVMALWHQRNRWAEGGAQSYLDYWQPLVRQRWQWRKSVDLLVFWLIKYGLPTAAVPDLLFSLTRNRLPVLIPLTSVTVTISLVGMFLGLRRLYPHQSPGRTTLQTLWGTFYMMHWLVVVASVTLRMSVRPKRLKWVKTLHRGDLARAA